MFNTNIRTILLFICVAVLSTVENKSFFGIGGRIIGDQLLSKDILTARSGGIDEAPIIRFHYAIPEPITYIEIVSEGNVLAVVNFSYHNDLVDGTVEAMNVTSEDVTKESFEVLIKIYGFNHTMLNVNPALIVNRDQEFAGILQPNNDDEDIEDEEIHLHQSDEAAEVNDDDHEEQEEDDAEDDYDYENSTEKVFADGDFEHADKIIEIGHRQEGDQLVYETFQTSLTTSTEPTNHSVVFYYIDDNFITYIKFVVFDPLLTSDENSNNNNSNGEQQLEHLYSHISHTSVKAIITDHKTTSLFVHMLVFGYDPRHVPVDYEPFLPPLMPPCIATSNDIDSHPTERPMSPMQRLRLMMNAANSVSEVSTEAESNQSDSQSGSGAVSILLTRWYAFNTITYSAIILFFAISGQFGF